VVLPAAVPALLVPAGQVAADPTPTDVAVPAAVVLAVQVAVVTLRVPAIPGTPAVVMIAAATSSVTRGSPETTALRRDVTTAPGREARIARSRVAMTGPVRVVMTDPVRVAMTDQLHVGTTVTHRVGGGMVGRIRAGRTARRQKTGSHRYGTTRATAVPRVARARRPVARATSAALLIVASAVTTEALPTVGRVVTTGAPLIVGRVATTGVRVGALPVGMTEVPPTADHDVMICRGLGGTTGLGRAGTIAPGLGGMMTALGRAGMTALGRAGTIAPGLGGMMTAPGRAGMTAPGRAGTIAPGLDGTTAPGRAGTTGLGRRVRLGVGGGRIAAHVAAIALRGRSGSAGPAVTRTRPARVVTIRRSPQVSPAPSSTVRSKPSCARCRGASPTWSRSTWSRLAG
jgi:hypothetical protein